MEKWSKRLLTALEKAGKKGLSAEKLQKEGKAGNGHPKK